MLSEDFDRNEMSLAISKGVCEAISQLRLDRNKIINEIGQSVYQAIMEIMSPLGGCPMTREDILEMVKKGVSKRDE